MIAAVVRSLELPVGSYALFGGTVLAMHGLRETGDIDIVCTDDVFESLKGSGWDVSDKNGIPFASRGRVEACSDMRRGDFQKTTDEIIAGADVIDGIPCASLADTRAFKMALGRPKDIVDIALIDGM